MKPCALFLNQHGGAHKSAPGCACKRAANADRPHTERRDLLHRELGRRAHQEVDRLQRDTSHDGPDLIARADTRCVETVGTNLRVGLEPPDRFVEIGSTDKTDSARPTSSISPPALSMACRAARILSTAAPSS